MMPDESGLELCRNLRSSPNFADVPVIMVSALIQNEDVRAGLEAGASAYLKKPVSPGVLTETVRQWIARVGTQLQPESSISRLESEVQRTIIEVKRRIAEIGRAHRVFEAYSRELQRADGNLPTADPAVVRRAVEMSRSRIIQAEAAGWRVLENTLRRLEGLEIAMRRRGVHEPKGKEQWELARARAPFVREDCRQWARSCPDHILAEYGGAIEKGDKIYAYLLERYGQLALEQSTEWEYLAELRARILAACRSNGDDLGMIEHFHSLVNPLMAQLSALRIPDQLVFVHQPMRNGHGQTPGPNGQPSASPPTGSRSDPPPD
jgi:YesN/AraC family two-component response regulator